MNNSEKFEFMRLNMPGLPRAVFDALFNDNSWSWAAKNHYTIADSGLMLPWAGRIWLNPPYGLEAAEWLSKLAALGNGIALIFARTETDMFRRYVWEMADAVFFFYGRLFFYRVDGTKAKANGGAPSCLVAYGENNVKAIQGSGLDGKLIILKEATR